MADLSLPPDDLTKSHGSAHSNDQLHFAAKRGGCQRVHLRSEEKSLQHVHSFSGQHFDETLHRSSTLGSPQRDVSYIRRLCFWHSSIVEGQQQHPPSLGVQVPGKLEHLTLGASYSQRRDEQCDRRPFAQTLARTRRGWRWRRAVPF